MRGLQALKKVIEYDDIKTILDIGSWNGEQATFLRSNKRQVTTIDMNVNADVNGNYLYTDFDKQFDCVWCSHVLEHQANVGQFLDKCYNDIRDGGLFAVTVPSSRRYGDNVVDGHLTYWNAGTLLYNLIVAGFDCSEARVLTYENDKERIYEISVIVRKKKAALPELSGDRGEIERLSKFFPLPVKQGFNGYIESVNW